MKLMLISLTISCILSITLAKDVGGGIEESTGICLRKDFDHCKTNHNMPRGSKNKCLNVFKKSGSNAIHAVYIELYSHQQGHCVVYFKSCTTTKCPAGTRWYQNYLGWGFGTDPNTGGDNNSKNARTCFWKRGLTSSDVNKCPKVCPPGEYNSDGTCEPCADGFFSSSENQIQCKPYTNVCRPGTYISSQTKTSDRTCELCADGYTTSSENQVKCDPVITKHCGKGIRRTLGSSKDDIFSTCQMYYSGPDTEDAVGKSCEDVGITNMEECAQSCQDLGSEWHSANWFATGGQGNCKCSKGDSVTQVENQDWMSCEIAPKDKVVAKTDDNPHHNRCPTCDIIAGKIFVAHTSTPQEHHIDKIHHCSANDGVCSCTCEEDTTSKTPNALNGQKFPYGVLCPNQPQANYCDCSGDCGSQPQWCSCGLAQATDCCGSRKKL